ncbi:matrixin family metalloprotease [Bdellovibrio bacteriovorus]|uniref:matrixin family metalloprotease n=1 Tax=Bdellovibrio bacteriovorus TaxID=959 RepID=UPI003A80A06C
MFKWIVLSVTLLSLCACEKGPSLGPGDDDLLASENQADCGFVQNSYGQRISWKSNIPVKLKLHSSYPVEFEDALNKAAQHWNDAAGMTLFTFSRVTDSQANTAAKDSKSTVHVLTEWPWQEAPKKNYQALTTLYWRSNQIYEADLILNEQFFNFFTYDIPSMGSGVHLESLMVHELGHVLGLKHRDNTVASVMWSILSSDTIRNTLTQADRDTIKCEY